MYNYKFIVGGLIDRDAFITILRKRISIEFGLASTNYFETNLTQLSFVFFLIQVLLFIHATKFKWGCPMFTILWSKNYDFSADLSIES